MLAKIAPSSGLTSVFLSLCCTVFSLLDSLPLFFFSGVLVFLVLVLVRFPLYLMSRFVFALFFVPLFRCFLFSFLVRFCSNSCPSDSCLVYCALLCFSCSLLPPFPLPSSLSLP